MVMLLVLGWLSVLWWVPSGSLTLWLSAGFALFAVVLAMPAVSRHWYWLPVGGLAGMGVVVGMIMTENAI
ncbi:hypothetical protein [Oceanisphaera pacifica]|uniref:DUF2484 family protein n=1 Tax=Oceanisphaera pacifica TaxID=2818389 RepID=A0ABS3NC52_9GAMM|nr:hypothetical protein [Oceanisphaera pacifica]MBO1518173.1 hypothetical protein [Oceanisphaera pacifica]